MPWRGLSRPPAEPVVKPYGCDCSFFTLTLTAALLAGCSNDTTNESTPSETPGTQQTDQEQTEQTQQEQTQEQTERTQTEKALALINTFATGDTETAKSLLAEGYIQHNLAYGTGRDAFIGSVEYLASAETKTTARNIRSFEDGGKVFLQTVYNFAGDRAEAGRTDIVRGFDF